MSGRIVLVTLFGTLWLPFVHISEVEGPFPSAFQAPSNWFAATAPPHKKSSLNIDILWPSIKEYFQNERLHFFYQQIVISGSPVEILVVSVIFTET